jgi:plastocyanin
MTETLQPGGNARRFLLGSVLGAGALLLFKPRLARADDSVEVKIDNFVVMPALIRVKKGTSVTWVNNDDIPHSIVCPVLQVHSHPMDTGEKFSYQFDKAGIYNYVCGLHPHMHGQIVVS